uniref:Transcription factor TFIIB cyclin-like domain-containing protein n=1 Tax=Ananas comosus var. bracteatus TaxID=296719 RepID=A0A6V7PGY4_ANACO|nr:unnamed protein product [Ananas comosus var. bracteatus]
MNEAGGLVRPRRGGAPPNRLRHRLLRLFHRACPCLCPIRPLLLRPLRRARAGPPRRRRRSLKAAPLISVDSLRAYLQIIDVASILGFDHDIADHAFELFKDCSSAICLKNRSVKALATSALMQAIREAQEPRTL